MNRRGFLTSLGFVVAAPAIVRASSLMAVKPLPDYGALINGKMLFEPTTFLNFRPGEQYIIRGEVYTLICDNLTAENPLWECLNITERLAD